MTLSSLDSQRMAEALALAETSFGLTEPNPRVGCILGHEDGRVLGRGATQQAGGPHAEVMALRDAQAAGCDLTGATAWVTLEPCAHHGRTPPCCDALVQAGIGRCVIALQDPFPRVSGAGIARLRAAGIAVQTVDDPAIVARARDINAGFLSRVERARPWVRMKIAATADGRVALPDGRSKWITGAEARADGHAWRRRAAAILTGSGTVLADDPRLDVREVCTVLQPLRVVLDSRLRTPPDAALLRPPGASLIIAAPGHETRAAALRTAGAEVWNTGHEGGMPSLDIVLDQLAARGINELHVEAGPTLSGALVTAGLVDELLLYLAPTVLGPGQSWAALPLLTELPPLDAPSSQSQPRRGRWVDASPVGPDLRLRMRWREP